MNTRSDRNLIMIPYADLQGAKTGVNITDNNGRKNVYLKNCCVALISAKHYNPDCDVALVTNIQVPGAYEALLSKHGVQILFAPFEFFRFDLQYTWALAFYKLCALQTVVLEHPHKAYCYLDTDIYVQGNFAPIWQECSEHIMLYDINHGLQVKDYQHFLGEIHAFMETSSFITHYGGEFFAAAHDDAVLFLKECSCVYKEMQEKAFVTTHGDEFITSIAAQKMRNRIKNAGAYIFRFWTGGFRLTSTCYQYNPVIVLHVPAEKERGMLTLFRRYMKKGIVPKNETVWRCLHLKHRSARVTAAVFVRKLLAAPLKR